MKNINYAINVLYYWAFEMICGWEADDPHWGKMDI